MRDNAFKAGLFSELADGGGGFILRLYFMNTEATCGREEIMDTLGLRMYAKPNEMNNLLSFSCSHSTLPSLPSLLIQIHTSPSSTRPAGSSNTSFPTGGLN